MHLKSMEVASAGSVAAVVRDLGARFAAETGLDVNVRHGPAGLLAQSILRGAATDAYVSASPTGPQQLHALGLFEPPVPLAHNRLALVARSGLSLDASDPLAALDHAGWRIAMSTPSADPGGDYAQAFFAALAASQPERAARILLRTQSMYGDVLPIPGQPQDNPVHRVLASGQADLALVYASGVTALQSLMPGLSSCALPEALSPRTTIMACCGVDSAQAVRRFLLFLQSDIARTAFAASGFALPAVSPPEHPHLASSLQ